MIQQRRRFAEFFRAFVTGERSWWCALDLFWMIWHESVRIAGHQVRIYDILANVVGYRKYRRRLIGHLCRWHAQRRRQQRVFTLFAGWNQRNHHIFEPVWLWGVVFSFMLLQSIATRKCGRAFITTKWSIQMRAFVSLQIGVGRKGTWTRLTRKRFQSLVGFHVLLKVRVAREWLWARIACERSDACVADGMFLQIGSSAELLMTLHAYIGLLCFVQLLNMGDDNASIHCSVRTKIANVRQHWIVIMGLVGFAFLLANKSRFAELTKVDVAKTFGHIGIEEFTVILGIGCGCRASSNQIEWLFCILVGIVFIIRACVAFRRIDNHNLMVASEVLVDRCHCAHHKRQLRFIFRATRNNEFLQFLLTFSHFVTKIRKQFCSK